LGGPAAVSKVALVPENAVNEAEQNVSKLLQGSATHMTYLFDDYTWICSPEALIIEPEASNGRLIALSKSNVEASFHVFREDAYMLRLSFQSSDEDALFRVHVDDYVKDVRLGRGTEGFSTEVDIGPLELKSGYHNITIEAEEGDPRLDRAILSNGVDMVQASLSCYADSEGLSYSMSSGSEYVIGEVESNLVFLEGGSGYWRLYGQEGEITPMTVFNYGSLFHVDGLRSQYTLRYLGLGYLEQGLLVTLVSMALVALGLKFLGPKRFTMWEPVR
jgi:hypothetical protein